MHDAPAEETPLVVATDGIPHHHLPLGADALASTTRLSVQEWLGERWEIVEILGEPGMIEPTPLDPAIFPGQYLGQRVVTA